MRAQKLDLGSRIMAKASWKDWTVGEDEGGKLSGVGFEHNRGSITAGDALECRERKRNALTFLLHLPSNPPSQPSVGQTVPESWELQFPEMQAEQGMGPRANRQ